LNLKEIFNTYKNVAVLGFSDRRDRASNRIGRYLKENDYNVTGVNPVPDKNSADNITIVKSLSELPENTEIINIFRRSEFLYDHINEILKMKTLPKVIWTQLGVIDQKAKELAEKNNIHYIENKCIMVEHNNIFGNN